MDSINLPPKENSIINPMLGIQFHNVVTGQDIDWHIIADHKAQYATILKRTGFRYLLSEKKLKEIFHNVY